MQGGGPLIHKAHMYTKCSTHSYISRLTRIQTAHMFTVVSQLVHGGSAHLYTEALAHLYTESLAHLYTESLAHLYTESLAHFYTEGLAPCT